MTICPACEAPIKTGDKVKVLIHGIYKQETGITHSISADFEQYVEHLEC